MKEINKKILKEKIHRSGNAWFCLAIRFYLGGLFVYASWHKIIYPELFAIDIATYDILPLILINPMAIVLPYIELVAGLMLLIGLRVRTAALLVTGMMAIFTIALIIALAQGLDMSCGCFASQGMEEDPISLKTLVRDLALFSAGFYVLFLDRKPIKLGVTILTKLLSVNRACPKN